MNFGQEIKQKVEEEMNSFIALLKNPIAHTW